MIFFLQRKDYEDIHCRWALAKGKRSLIKTGFSHHVILSIWLKLYK